MCQGVATTLVSPLTRNRKSVEHKTDNNVKSQIFITVPN